MGRETEPDWPATDGRLLFLLDSSSQIEDQILRSWIQRRKPTEDTSEIVSLTPSRRRRPGVRTEGRLADLLSGEADLFVVPLRVAWFPHRRHGTRSVRWSDVLKLGDPRDPDAIRQRVIWARWPERVEIVAGEGALATSLCERHRTGVEAVDICDFVTRQAWLALERAERRLRGNRYKVSRFLAGEISSRTEFRERAVILGGRRGLGPEASMARAEYYLREIAASHRPFLIDLIANSVNWVISQGYGSIVYDQAKVDEIAAIGQEHPLAFLPSHRSNLDRPTLQFILWENDLPPNHTAGGINMNFFPVGPLMRRTGVFFIRRTFKGNDLYKFVLQCYLDYLVEKRFPLEWYLEGGRSRTGKLLPPRFGMLSYVVDAIGRYKSDDLYLVPVSISYDHIQDLSSYIGEALGAAKEKESFTWAVGFIRSLRKRYGNIHVRFAEPLSVVKELGEPSQAEQVDIAKLAFEVMHRIATATPITPTALLCISLLAAKGRAITGGELAASCAVLHAYIDKRGSPTTEPLAADDQDQIRALARWLAEHRLLDTPGDDLYVVTGDQAARSAYYRNVVVHYFVPRALAELALLKASETGGDRVEVFWEEMLALRDLLKFEFFFSEKDRFRQEVDHDLALDDPAWEEKLADGRPMDGGLLPGFASWAVVPFLEAYRVVADELAASGFSEEKAFLRDCLVRARQYRLRQMITSDESVTLVLFKSALSLAANRELLEGDDAEGRAALAAEIGEVLERAARTPG